MYKNMIEDFKAYLLFTEFTLGLVVFQLYVQKLKNQAKIS